MKWHHAGIQVQNLEVAIRFYENVFHFRAEQFLSLPGEKIVFLKKGEVRIELIESYDVPVLKNSIHLSWQVEKVYDWIEKLKNQGYHPIEGPYKLDNGWTTVFFEGINNEVMELIEVI